jgi:RecB family exonuclease
VLIEESFEHPHSDGVRITSRVDLVARGADGLEIIDWKTGNADTNSLSENRQLQTYYWLFRRVRPDEPVTRVRLASLRAAKPNSAIADDGYDALTNEFIDAMVDRVRNEVFDPQPGKQCDRCEFRALCPAHQRGQEAPW